MNVVPVLHSLGFQLRRVLSSSSAPPFLGLALPSDQLDRAREIIPQAIGRDLTGLLGKHGTVVAWAICACLAEDYGDKGGNVWPIVAKLLGRREIDQPDRRTIVSTFERVCRREGLPFGGLVRNVDAFLLHAGPVRRQLPHLATAFLTHERAVGAPPDDDTVALNRWEDDALVHLDHGLSVMPRCIIMDASAYMGTAFLDWRKGRRAETEYLGALHDALEKEDRRGGGSRGTAAPARPRLTWDDGRPHLDIPDLTGTGARVRVRIDDQMLRLRPGAHPLPLPPGRRLEWDEADAVRTVSLYEADHGPGGVVAFDVDTGRRIPVEGSVRTFGVSTPSAMLTARAPFEVDGEPVPMLGPDLYGRAVDIRDGAVRITIGGDAFQLSGTRRTRITVSGDPIARGSTRLWGGEAVIGVDRGQYAETTQTLALWVRLTTGGEMAEGRVPLSGMSDDISVRLSDLFARAGLPEDGDPCRLRLTLLRDAGDGFVETRFHKTLDIWPGFAGRRNRLIDSIYPPRNVRLDACAHLERDDGGRLCLEAGAGFTEARLVFDVAGELRSYAIRPTGTTAVLELSDGSRAPWALGNTLVVGGKGAGGALVIRSPRSKADLYVGKRVVVRPFEASGTWAVPLATLRGDGDVALIHPDSMPLRIAAVECASEPVSFGARTWTGGCEIRISMRDRVDALRVVRTSETGAQEMVEIRFDHRPSDTPGAPWVRARSGGNGIIVVEARTADPGLSLLDFSIESSDETGERRWSRLSNGRGDRYAGAIVGPDDEEARPSALRRIDRWMQDCYSASSWVDARLGDILTARWRKLLERVMRAPGGDGFLLSLVHGDGEAEAAAWLPMRHPLEVVAMLHAAPSHAFASLAGAGGEAGRAMRRLDSLRGASLRDCNWIDPVALMAFSNSKQAQHGARLEGFSGERLAKFLRADPERLRSLGRRWDGTVVLGKEHAGAALRRLSERIEDHGLLEHSIEDGPMSGRSLKLHHLCRSCAEAGRARALSAPDDDGSVPMIDRLLAAYASAARDGSLHALLERIGGRAVLPMLGEAARLGPELLAFHLLSAELETTR